jgi:hypothetical protein
MHLILDQGIPRDAAIRLRELGHECTHLGEVGMSKAMDAIVQLIQKVLSVFQADLETGALVTVKGHKTTCHKLPVGGSDKGVPI